MTDPCKYFDPARTNADITLSNENATATGVGNNCPTTLGEQARSTGKWYAELVWDTKVTAYYPYVGICLSGHTKDDYMGYTAHSWAWEGGPNHLYIKHNSGNAATEFWSATVYDGADDVVMIAVDIDNHKLWFGVNGVWVLSGDPAAGSNAAITNANITGDVYIGATLGGIGDVFSLRVSLAGFTYDPPDGFSAWGGACGEEEPEPEPEPPPSPEQQRRYLEITTRGGATVKLSDHVKATYTDIISVWGEISSDKMDPVTYELEPASASFSVINNVAVGGTARFSGITGLIFAKIEIWQEGTKIFSGTIDSLTNIGWADCTVHCIGITAELNKLYSHIILDADTYADADPQDLGKMLPHVYGTPKRVPFLGAQVGFVSPISEEITATTTTIGMATVPGSSQLPATGKLVIGGRLTAYTHNGTNITISALGAAIPRGAVLAEHLDEYVYIIGDKVTSIDAVYVDGVIVPAIGYDAFTGQDGDEHADFPGLACISFTQNPSVIATEIKPIGLQTSGGEACPSVESGGTMESIDRVYNFYMSPAEDWSDGDNDSGDEFTTTILENTALPTSAIHAVAKSAKVKILIGPGIVGSPAASSVAFYINGNVLSTDTVSYLDTTSKQWHEVTCRLGNRTLEGDTSIEIVLYSSPSGQYFKVYEVYFEYTYTDIYEIESINPETQIGYIYPVYQSEPPEADAKAFDKSLATYFDSAVTTCNTETFESADHYFCVFKFPALCAANIPGEIRSVKLRIYADNSYAADPDTDVNVENGNSTTGVSIEDSFDPSSAPAWFEFDATEWDAFKPTDIYIYFNTNVGSNIRIHEIYFEVTYDGAAPATIGAAVKGPGAVQSSIGTIGKVAADVTADVTDPADILQEILNKCGKSALADTGSPSTYAAAQALWDNPDESSPAKPYAVALAVLQPPNVRNLMTRVAMQCRAIQFWINDVNYLKLMGGTYATDADIEADDIWQNQAWMNYTNKAYIANDMAGRYNHYWWGSEEDGGQAVVKAADANSPSSQDTYGTLKQSISLAYIPGETQAQDVLNWRLSELKNPRLIVVYVGTLTNNINRQVGQIITFDTTDSDLDNLLGGLVPDTMQFLICEVAYQSDGGIRITAIEMT